YVIMIEATMPPEEAAVRADRFLMEEMFPYLFTLNERAREIVLSCAKRIADVRLSGVPFKSKE
ncbi:MAG: hypothetical protein P4L67_00565, partial [Candidatus Pacebacteria bacterium]|nr:hypothetical protein [Candidatus Paceibacterota bacterium]